MASLWTRPEWSSSWRSAKKIWRVVSLRTKWQFPADQEILMSRKMFADGQKKYVMVWSTYMVGESFTETWSWKISWYDTPFCIFLLTAFLRKCMLIKATKRISLLWAVVSIFKTVTVTRMKYIEKPRNWDFCTLDIFLHYHTTPIHHSKYF